MLSVRRLRTYFDTPSGPVRAVEDVSFDLHRHDVLAIVGESGSGKSVTGLSIMRLVPTPPGRHAGGEVVLHGRDLLALEERALERVRGRQMAMIFQNPRAALNPAYTVLTQMVETLRRHEAGLSQGAAKSRALAMMSELGFPEPRRTAESFPHQLSGGMCQRVGIALAMACRPELLIADEPTTALDVLVQATILLLLERAHREHALPIILITHDFGVVRAIANRVIVMYAGRVQETGAADAVLSRPQHPYTRALIDSVPNPDRPGRRLRQIGGQPPDPARPPAGCAFAPRCDVATAECWARIPTLHPTDTGHVRCHLLAPGAGGAGR